MRVGDSERCRALGVYLSGFRVQSFSFKVEGSSCSGDVVRTYRDLSRVVTLRFGLGKVGGFRVACRRDRAI